MDSKHISIILCTLFVLLLVPMVTAISIATTDKINYYDIVENHTVSITNFEGAPTTYSIIVPAGWTGFSGSGCVEAGGVINCTAVPDNATVNYTLQNPIATQSYDITTVSTTTIVGTTNDVNFISIPDNEIFHTLIEYGRGRGNYFYNSYSENTSGSGHSGLGYPYLPNGTLFQLNYLHKLFNIKQYFGLADSDATNATWTCTYTNDTVVRQHLATNISRSSEWTVVYGIDEIEGSWERMGYLGQDFFADAYTTGTNITINCTDIRYTLAGAGGDIYIAEDSVTLQFRNREPFVASASSTAVIGNGTQEVLITYIINNSEIYPTDEIMIEIMAPEYAEFIGVRGELWGTAQDSYVTERTDMLPGDSETITLVARFDTTVAPNISTVQLADAIKIKYITPWEANAYNPAEYIQLIDGATLGTAAANMGVPTDISSIQSQLNLIYDLQLEFNITLNQINNTVNVIETYVDYFNTTIFNGTTLQDILDAINNAAAPGSNVSNTQILNAINDSRDTILAKLQRLQDFDEELVFLVTDSFVLQDRAQTQINNGDRESALDSLRESNEKLREASERLAKVQLQTESRLDNSFPWIPVLLVFIGLGVLGFYFYTRHKEENNRPPRRRRNVRKPLYRPRR